jgi:RNA polymerase sigma-70 factor (ECF subfamily)
MIPFILGRGPTAPTSLSLLERARDHDRSAWERLAELYYPLVARWCWQAGMSGPDAADVGQEVFLAVATRISAFERRQEGSFRSWMRAITRSKIADHLRQASSGPRPEGGSEARRWLELIPADGPIDRSAPPDSGDHDVLYRRAVRLIMGEFEERTWMAFWQVTVEGRDPAEVAAGLGTSRNAVYLAKARVLKRLRDEFQGLIDG